MLLIELIERHRVDVDQQQQQDRRARKDRMAQQVGIRSAASQPIGYGEKRNGQSQPVGDSPARQVAIDRIGEQNGEAGNRSPEQERQHAFGP